ncbi:MAG: hypothetical protein QXV32_07170 [Conexivisphaerales archaeon]
MTSASAEDSNKKKWYMPKYYYWAKSPPKPSQIPAVTNPQQKKFYRIMIALRLARVAAIAIVLAILFLKL